MLWNMDFPLHMMLAKKESHHLGTRTNLPSEKWRMKVEFGIPIGDEHIDHLMIGEENQVHPVLPTGLRVPNTRWLNPVK